MKEKEKKEMELRVLVVKVRFERIGVVLLFVVVLGFFFRNMMDIDDTRSERETRETKEEREERSNREKIREERRRERERERRLEVKDVAMGKKSKIIRDRDRDISEKVVFGMVFVGILRGGEVMYD